LKNVWIVSCEGNPVAAYTEESEANLFAIRASGLMQIGGFKVQQVLLYEPDSTNDKTVFTPPAVPMPAIVSPYA
jgi:hypothetical protein